VTPPTSLPAGRYRLVLLAETTASVRIDLPGVSASYTATTPVPTAARFIDIGTAGRARVSSAVTAGRATFVAASVEAAYGQSSYAEACLAAVGYDCSTTSGGGGGFAYTSPGATRTHAQTGRLYVPGEMPVRTYDAVMSATSVGTNVVRKGFLLTIG
jgi:hypothetical protein